MASLLFCKSQKDNVVEKVDNIAINSSVSVAWYTEHISIKCTKYGSEQEVVQYYLLDLI